MEDFNKPLWQLTIGELVTILDSRQPKIESKNVEQKINQPKYVYGIVGLANLLGCSKNHAGKLKGSGMFDEAIIQNGRKIIIDSEKALELFKNKSR